LAVNWQHPQEVLIIEAKAFLQVDDLNEIKSATVEMQRAQDQIGRIVRILTSMPLAEKKSLFPFVEWEKVERWFGVIVTPETEPAINFDHTRVPAASLQTLNNRLRPKDWLGPRRIWQAMVNREWQSAIRNARHTHEQFSLANIIFEIPLIEISH
jgi:hypothetical protein